MKIKSILLLSLIILFILPSSAHEGNTDDNGGHFDNSTGEYHYHHGYPPHQHISGTCPYNFDDKTNHGSVNSSNTQNSSAMDEHIQYVLGQKDREQSGIYPEYPSDKKDSSNDTSGNNEVKKDREKVHDMAETLKRGGAIQEVDSGFRTPIRKQSLFHDIVEREKKQGYGKNYIPTPPTDVPGSTKAALEQESKNKSNHENKQIPQQYMILFILLPLAIVIMVLSIKSRQN